MRSRTPLRRTVLRAVPALVAVTLVAPLVPTAATAATDPLQQTLSASEPTVTDRKAFDDGHIDIGPRWQDGKWTLQVHSGVSPDAEWRAASDAVLHVSDAARQAVPDDPTYDFLHTEPGTEVSVIPQTQQSGVVWVGWNTQDPAAMEVMRDGVTMSLHGVQGPGDLVVYLQSGSLGAPQVLWDSAAQLPQDLFVDVNSHTHANWVFTKPGVYLVDMEIRATLRDGSTVTDTEPVRFAVGDATIPDAAFAARWTGKSASPTPTPTAAAAAIGSGLSDAGVLGIGVGAGVLVLVLVVVVIGAARGARARRRARAAAPAGGSDA